MSKSDNERRSKKSKVEFIPTQDEKRRNRQMQNALRNPALDEDWEDLDFDTTETRQHKQPLR